MRVDVLTREYPPTIYGGAGVHVAELVRVLRSEIQVLVRAFGEPRDEFHTFSYQSAVGFETANPTLQTLSTDLAMVQDIEGADLVHSHTWYANFAGQVAKELHGIPHVITAHSLEPLRPWKEEQLGGGYRLSSWIERTAYEGCTKIIAVSNGMQKDILKAYPQLDPKKISVIHNGIDLKVFQSTADPELVRGLGINPEARSVVFVGRITKQKGLPYLLKAAKQLPADVQLVLCAGSPDTPEILAEVKELIADLRSTREGVIWLDKQLPRRELISVLSSATVFACPSIYEPLGIVNLEAMACRIPVVATATGGIPEVVIDGQTGILVQIEQLLDGSGTPTNPEKFVADFAAALMTMLDHKDISKFGNAGRTRVEENFSWDKIARETLSIYRQALESIP
jgi:starch synthase